MGMVALQVGGRRYDLACRDGDEPRLRALAAVVDAKVGQAATALGPTNEGRQLLFAALLLADELAERPVAPPPPDTDGLAEALDLLAARVEKLADALEPAADAP